MNLEINKEDIKETENKTTEAKVTLNKPKPTKKNKAVCPVISVISNTKVIIDFNNFGLIVNTNNAEKLKGKRIEIEYTGTIGKEDFKFEVKKCIK